MQESYYVQPIPKYISQFASRELVSDYLDKRIDAALDTKWKNFGFEKKEDYEFWIFRLCGLVCTKMVLDTFSEKSSKETIAQLTQKGVNLGGYKTYDEDGNFIDMGWFYQPLVELAKEYGVNGQVYRTMSIDELGHSIRNNEFPIISVNPKVIRGDIKTSEKKGGHLILVVGMQCNEKGIEGFFIHNPSGRNYSQQEKAYITIERFLEAFAGRGFTLYK